MKLQPKKIVRPIPPAVWGIARMSATPTTGLVPSVRGIYRITCVPLKKHYIGQAKNLARRFLEHNVKLLNQTHTNSQLREAFAFYGPRAFTFEVLEFVNDPSTLALSLAEQRHMDHHDLKFNVRPAGDDNFISWRANHELQKRAKLAGRSVEEQLVVEVGNAPIPLAPAVKRVRRQATGTTDVVRALPTPSSDLTTRATRTARRGHSK